MITPRRATLFAALMAVLGVAHAQALELGFTAQEPGGLPQGWSEQRLAKAKPVRYVLETEEGRAVVRAESVAAASSLLRRLDLPGAGRLSWRWRVDHALVHADLKRKSADDFAARVYLTFDAPDTGFSLADRLGLALARLTYDPALPSAALCYVWDNRAPVGTIVASAYTDRVRMIVLESGNAYAGQWREESRDVAADYRAAFGQPVPRLTGIALMSDTDQTGESVTAWYADFRFQPQAGSASQGERNPR
jgi:hypothetical protein